MNTPVNTLSCFAPHDGIVSWPVAVQRNRAVVSSHSKTSVVFLFSHLTQPSPS